MLGADEGGGEREGIGRRERVHAEQPGGLLASRLRGQHVVPGSGPRIQAREGRVARPAAAPGPPVDLLHELLALHGKELTTRTCDTVAKIART
jgi:hypothetical protein